MGQKGRKTAVAAPPKPASPAASKKKPDLAWRGFLLLWALFLLVLAFLGCRALWLRRQANGRITPDWDRAEPFPVTDYEDAQRLYRLSRAAMEEGANLRFLYAEIETVTGEALYLNGHPLREEDLIEERVPADLPGPERRQSDGPRLLHYRIGPLYGEIRVTDEAGEELHPLPSSDQKTLFYRRLPKARYSVSILAPKEAVLKLNGSQLRPEDLSEVERGTDGRTWLCYEVDGLYQEPRLTAEDQSGAPLPVETDRFGTMRVYPPEVEPPQELRDTAEEFFSHWMAYLSVPNNPGQLYWLCAHMVYDSEMYHYVNQSTDGMAWVPVTEVRYERLDFAHFWQEEDCFSCTVSCDAELCGRFWAGPRSYGYSKCYALEFVKENGRWLLSEMTDIT